MVSLQYAGLTKLVPMIWQCSIIIRSTHGGVTIGVVILELLLASLEIGYR